MRGRVRWRGAFAVFLSVLLVAVVAPAKAWAGDGSVSFQYVDRKWENGRLISTTKTMNRYDYAWWTTNHLNLHNGWWYTRDIDVSTGDRLNVDSGATANLVLWDGKTMEFRDGIHVPPGSTLNIYGGVNGTGKLVVGRSKADTAAIGGNNNESGGTINIYGGTIEVRGGSHNTDGGAGIGGGNAGGAGNINIYGGTITAKGGPNAAGIGGGDRTDGGKTNGTVSIYGGNVTATGGSDSSNGGAGIGGGGNGWISGINIYGGSVTARGGANAAGIGGGAKQGGPEVLNISGGTVKAYGDNKAAGIGGGQGGWGSTINISGGDITAQAGNDAAGIGGGDTGDSGNITISGGTISATGGSSNSRGGAGIGGGGMANGRSITITGGNITKAQGGANASGIGGGDEGNGGTIKITGGIVNAKGGSKNDDGGAGIGGGNEKAGGNITIGGNAVVTAQGGHDGAGIGGGENADGGTITIDGGTVYATGGTYGAGIGSGQDGKSAGTILIKGNTSVTATGGDSGAGIGGGEFGGRAGSITIEGGIITARGGHLASGIGSGRWSHKHVTSNYYADAVSVTIKGYPAVNAKGGAGGAGIGAGWMGPSGRIEIYSGTVDATGGRNGGAGIGSGAGCSVDTVTTVNVTIKGGNITATPGEMNHETNNTAADPGAAIGTGGCEKAASIGNTQYESYFVGDIYLSGGNITAYSADITKEPNEKREVLNVIGTTSDDNKAWFAKGKVHFDGATVDMYPGPGVEAIKQVVKASEVNNGGVLFTDSEGLYQRVTYATHKGDVNNMKESKGNYRYNVLTGAQDVEDFEGTKEEVNEYKRVRVEPVHRHDFKYTVNEAGDTITATCYGRDCPLPNKTAQLTIVRPEHSAYDDGKSAVATVIDEGHIRNGAAIKYYKVNADGSQATDFEEGKEAPTLPGKYKAEITLGTKDVEGVEDNYGTAYVIYDIAKGANPATIEPTATVQVGNNIDLSHNVKDKLEYSSVTYRFVESTDMNQRYCTLSDGTLYTNEDRTTAGEVHVEVTVAGDENHEPKTETITVTITDRPRQIINAENVTATYGDENVSVKAKVTGNVKGKNPGKLSYAVEEGLFDDSPIDVDENGMLTIHKAGTAKVIVTAAPTEAYAAASKTVTVTINKAPNPATVEPRANVKAGESIDLSENVTVPEGYTLPEGGINYAIVGNAFDNYIYDSTLYTMNTYSGPMKVKVTIPADDKYERLEKEINVNVAEKKPQKIAAADVEVTYGDRDKKIEASVTEPNPGGTLSYVGYDDIYGNVATVDPDTGELTIKNAGVAYFTVKAAETSITVGTGEPTHYAESYEDVMVTVKKAPNPATVTSPGPVIAGQSIDLSGCVTVPEGYTPDGDIEYEITGDDHDCYLDGSTLHTDNDNPGEVKVAVYVPGDSNHEDRTGEITVTVDTNPRQIVIADDELYTAYGATDAQITAEAYGNVEGANPGALSYTVTNEQGDAITENPPITVDGTGKLTINHVPEDHLAYVKVTAAATDVYTTPASDIVTVWIDKGIPATALTIEGWTYGETAKAPTIELAQGIDSDQVTFEYKSADASDYAYSTKPPTQAGSYYVRATIAETANNEGFTITSDAPFTIAKKQVAAVVTVMTKEYDGLPDATVFASVTEGLVEGDSIAISDVTGIFANESVTDMDANVGENKPVYLDASEATIFGNGSENYDVVFPETVPGTITKAMAVIMVDDLTVTFGETVNPLMFDAIDFTSVDGDVLEYTLSCDHGNDVGEYPIKAVFDPNAEANANYDVVCFDGTLTITNAELTVAASGYAGTYDGKSHGITVTAGPSKAGAAVYYSTEKPLDADNYGTDGSTTNPTFTDAGTHTVYYCVVAGNFETVSGSKKVIIDKANAAIKAAPVPISGLVENGKAQALVKAGNVEGGTMEYSLDYATWSDTVPTGTEAGPYVVYYRAKGDANHNDCDISLVLANIGEDPNTHKPTYHVTKGGNATWAKGTEGGHSVTFKRFAEDEINDTTYVHFRSASVDGVQITEGSDYTKAEGGVIITLLPAYLNAIQSGKHTLTATFDDGTAETTFTVSGDGKVTPAPDKFPDVPEGSWFHGVIYTAVGLGLFNGYDNGYFGPNDRITRGQAAVVIWHLMGNPEPEAGGAKAFPDVQPGRYYTEAVDWASSAGVVNGYKDGYYRPDEPVTREQFATILANFARNVAGRDTSGSAADYAAMKDAAKVSQYAERSVGWCFRSKILSGTKDGRINPQGYTTRAEAAKMIVVLYGLLNR